jgi:hypothetical protein
MSNKSDKHIPASVHVVGGEDNVVANNISIGQPLLHAADTKRLTAAGNISVVSDDPAPKKSWHERPFGLVVLMVIAGIIVGAVLFALKWT